jgi:transcriptional regulator with XRE-family HTH domain
MAVWHRTGCGQADQTRGREVITPLDATSRRELAEFLCSRRERIAPAEVGLPSGARRRTKGLRREEVAVLAGLSPTWYTYMEQGRDIQPSRQVLDSLAQVLRLSEDERRYVHSLVHGDMAHSAPLTPDIEPAELIRQLVAQHDTSPYPVYAVDRYCDLLAWNPACATWYADFGALSPDDRNILRWMLTAPAARERMVDWEADVRDVLARWRAEYGRHPDDQEMRRRVVRLAELSPHFAEWWEGHHVLEHRSAVRTLRHERFGVRRLRIVAVFTPETMPSGIVLHLPLDPAE